MGSTRRAFTEEYKASAVEFMSIVGRADSIAAANSRPSTMSRTPSGLRGA